MKSPTCTQVDVDQVNFLADKLGIDAVEYGMDIFRREGEAWHRETEMHEERAYSVEELTNYLQQAGFVEIRQYGNLKLRRPEAGEERIFFTARKPKETKK